MNFQKITGKVYYVGVNDRSSFKFENLWPLPYGVSYNSYLVEGSDKNVLIDCVDIEHFPVLRKKINNDLHGRKIDLLVVNHMEPDHSGAIPQLLELYPNMKIVGNKITLGMLNGFYGIDQSRFLEVKDQDEINLGDRTLKFYLTPLVHWPETMMTYVPEDKVLFSGDGFGCFGALNGGVIDSDMDLDIYFPEMYRYYSNIVGKYGKTVQMALKKLSSLDIEYICSTHGPVWHDRIKEVVDIYNRLSLYEGEEGVTIVYGSMYGHTAEIAELICNRLNERGIKKIRVHNISKSDLSFVISDAFRYKGLIVGSPTYNGRMFPLIEEFMTAIENREIKNKVIATFGSYTWASAACKLMNECYDRLGLSPAGTLDVKQAPTKTDEELAMEIADKVAEKILKG